MFTIGIDIGSHYAKGVKWNGDKVVAHTMFGIDTDLLSVYEKVLKGLSIDSDADIAKTVVTGVGGRFLADKHIFFPELVCHAKGIVSDFPSTRTVIAVGAENFSVGKMDAAGDMLDFGTNDKCAAGSGLFIEEMANALDINVAEMGDLAVRATQDINMSATCTVFAESEVISMNHKKIPKEDISRAILKSIATRILALVKRIGLKKDVVVTGGCSKNAGIIKLLEELFECPVIVPEDPDITAALGAAILAQE